MKKISVIIPHHQESVATMTPVLSSLAAQVGIDWKTRAEIIIVNDDPDHAISPEMLETAYPTLAPYTRTFFNPNKGYMGVSRQIGIDNAQGDYLVFCDADDALYSVTILYDLSTRGGADVYSYGFAEQCADGRWLEHPSQFTWMFAKAYRKQFLTDHEVRFSNNLLWHEDTYFNQVLLAYDPRVEVLPYTGYVWLYSPDTITRRNNAEYTSRSMCMFIDALDARLDRVRHVIPQERRTRLIIDDIVYMYCVCQNEVQTAVLDEVRGAIETRLAAYIRKHDPSCHCMAGEVRQAVHERICNTSVSMRFIPNEGFDSFIRRIMNGINK